MELKVEREKVIEASKVSAEAKEVLEKLFPSVFDTGDYFKELCIGKGSEPTDDVKTSIETIISKMNWELFSTMDKYFDAESDKTEFISKLIVDGIKNLNK